MDYEYSKLIGKRIQEMRLAKGLTQDQLSAKLQIVGCDLTRSALAKIEVGQRHLYPDEIKGLKTVFQTSYEELFV